MVDRSPGFFDLDERLAELSAKGDGLERVQALVDFEMFRPRLEAAVPRADRSKGGRPAFDPVLMFKVLILQAMHALSDERTEFLIKDRLSFMRFLAMSGQIVDATIVATPKQRNTIEEKKAIKDGQIPADWKDKPAKLAQKDRDARWTVKYSKAKPREDGSVPAVDLATLTNVAYQAA